MLLTVPPIKTVTAARAFCVSGPSVWNGQPFTVRETSSQPQFLHQLEDICFNEPSTDHGAGLLISMIAVNSDTIGDTSLSAILLGGSIAIAVGDTFFDSIAIDYRDTLDSIANIMTL
jgi:hypothetical protein